MGIVVSRNRVARHMRVHGIQARRKQHCKCTTKPNISHDPAPNLLAQDFGAEATNETWVADITYIETHEGWLYLPAILDVYSRKIVWGSMSTRLQTQLVEDALKMAVGRRAFTLLRLHSDQGSQYTSHDFLALLKQHGIQVSMSRVKHCHDNAMMESFFATLKTNA